MKKNIFYFCVSILFFTSPQLVTAQDNAKDIYAAAEQYFIDENYPAALPLYIKLDSTSKGSESADINFKIGYCYLNSPTYKVKAIPYMEQAIKNIAEKYTGKLNETGAPVSAYYYLAKAYHLNYEFDKAIECYEKYIKLLGSSSKNASDIADAKHEIETCNYGKELVKAPVKVIITNLGENVNSPYADYAPVVSLDEETLIFTSRRKGGLSDVKLPNGQYLEDIYISKYVGGDWGKAKLIDSTINTTRHEATVNLSADGQKLLIFRDSNGGDIYVSELKGEHWGVPTTIEPPVNSPYWESHACFSADNRIIYFVSNRPGGYGGRDIYKCLRLPNGKWGAPQNLGENINTKYDEDGVFIHPDGKQIYFSSKGHNSMGGFDIFTSKMDDENGFWSPPVNYCYPVNTTDDDVFLITNADGKRAYFSTDKEGGFGEKDIYMIEFPEYTPRDISVLIGKIQNNSGKTMENNAIYIIDTKTGDTTQVLTANSTTGKFGTTLPIGATYKIVYTIDDKEFYTETINAEKGTGFNISQKEIAYPIGSEFAPQPEKIEPLDVAKKDDLLNNKKDDEFDDADAAQTCNLQKLNFQLTFPYNQNDFEVKLKEFNRFCNNLKLCILANHELVVEIESSASRVPTRKYGSNKHLAELRANVAERKLIAALAKRGIPKSQLNLSGSKSSVQGPEYKNDALKNRALYEQFQYIKITGSIRK